MSLLQVPDADFKGGIMRTTAIVMGPGKHSYMHVRIFLLLSALLLAMNIADAEVVL